MNDKKDDKKPVQDNVQAVPRPKRPNETGSITVEGHIRIFDPKTKDVYVEKRA